jgi:hypothetical protein
MESNCRWSASSAGNVNPTISVPDNIGTTTSAVEIKVELVEPAESNIKLEEETNIKVDKPVKPVALEVPIRSKNATQPSREVGKCQIQLRQTL